MNYEQLVGLLTPGQFEQMQVVRDHLLKNPAGLDRSSLPAELPTEDKPDGR